MHSNTFNTTYYNMMLMMKLVRSCECIVYRFDFTLSILFRAEVRALLCLSVLFNRFDHVIICCIAICFVLVLANKINNNNTLG